MTQARTTRRSSTPSAVQRSAWHRPYGFLSDRRLGLCQADRDRVQVEHGEDREDKRRLVEMEASGIVKRPAPNPVTP